MEFTARTVTHPNPRLDKKAAITSLKKHPQFKPGTVIVGLEQKKGHWVATLHEPKGKVAAPPPFLDDDVKSESVPTDEVMPDEPMEEEGASEEEPDSEGDEKKDDGKKPTLESIMGLVEQIAQAVGVPTDGGDKPKLDDMPGEPMDDALPPLDGPPAPPPGPPKGGPAGPKETIHRKAPMGVTPVGAPAFASTKTAKPKVASFDVQEPWTGTIKEAMDAINSQYGQHGYKVKKIRAEMVDGQRVIRARVSVR